MKIIIYYLWPFVEKKKEAVIMNNEWCVSKLLNVLLKQLFKYLKKQFV